MMMSKPDLRIRLSEAQSVQHPVSFILANTDHGVMILNRHDHNQSSPDYAPYGVSVQMLDTGKFEISETVLYAQLLRLRRKRFGNGVIALDIGANVGAHTCNFAKTMKGWGSVISFEPQQRLFYALAGNITIQNHFNAHAVHGAIGKLCGKLNMPQPDYEKPGSFGSLELIHADDNENIGQPISYEPDDLIDVDIMTVDALNLKRLDFMKIDVERMELDVLDGAEQTIQQTKPIIAIENFKVNNQDILTRFKHHGYSDMIDMGGMIVALPDMGEPNIQDHVELDAEVGLLFKRCHIDELA